MAKIAAVTLFCLFAALPARAATGYLDIAGGTYDLAADHSGTGWTWTASAATLTLTGNITGDILFRDGEGDVVITTNNTVSVAGFIHAEFGKLTINGSGTLNVTSNNENAIGANSVAISGNVNVTSDNGTAIYAQNNITISSSGTVNATSANGTAIAARSVSISDNANVTANAGYSAINAWPGDITISGSANVTVNNSMIYAGGITISGNANVNVMAGDYQGYSILSNTDVTIGGNANVTVNSIRTEHGNITISTTGTVKSTMVSPQTFLFSDYIYITGGTVTATCSSFAAVSALRSITISGASTTVNVSGSYYALDASAINVQGGTVTTGPTGTNADIRGTLVHTGGTLNGHDLTAPTLTAGAVSRTSHTTATVKFTSNEAGQYYYKVVSSTSIPGTVSTSGPGTPCGVTEETISLTTLSSGKWYIYIVVKDAAGNVSASLRMAIPLPPVSNLGGTAEVTYAGRLFDLAAIGGLFTIDANAGRRTYTVEEGGAGAGTMVSTSTVINVTKAGTLVIGLATAATTTYAEGEKVTGTLTVNKGSQSAPAGLGKFDVTSGGGSNGMITRVTTAMEYRLNNPSVTAYTACTGATVTGLPAGSYLVRYKETDLYNASPDSEPVVIGEPAAPPAITTDALAAGAVGAAYSQTLAATGTAPIAWSIASGALPAGLSLNAATGEISGTPTAAGTATFTVKASNGVNPDATKALSILVAKAAQAAPPAPTLAGKTASSVTLNAIAGAEYSRDNGANWQDGATFSSLTANTSYIFTARMKETATHSASPASAGLTVTTAAAAYALTVTNGTGSGSYEAAAQVAIAADTPPAGQQFKNWTSSGGGTFANANSASTTFAMPPNAVTVTANYEAIPAVTYAVTVSSAGSGASGSGSYAQGATVSISAGTPPPGRQFSHWTASPQVTFANANSAGTSFTMPANAVTVTANFEAIPPVIVDAATPTITAHPQSASYMQGNAAMALTVTASVADGGTLSYQWYRNTANSNSGGAEVGANSRSYTPPTATVGTAYYYAVVTNTNSSANGAKTATAKSSVAAVTVNARAYTISFAPMTNGTVTADKTSATEGETVTLTVAPASGFILDAISTTPTVETLHATSLPDTYEFTMPASSVTVTATFQVATGIDNPEARAFRAHVKDGQLHVVGLTAGKPWSVYGVSGVLMYQDIAGGDEADVHLPVRGVYIVRSGVQTLKVVY